MNSKVAKNFDSLKPALFALPLLLLTMLIWWLYQQNVFSAGSYVEIQKGCFYYLNSELSRFPKLMFNFTQLGDAFILLSIISIFIVLAPKIWEALVPALLFSLLFSKVFKSWFSVPRPAEILDQGSFTIVGKTLTGFSSLPSGHSITIFTILTVLMFGFMPKNFAKKTLWIFTVVLVGLCVAFSRVGVGAHYPLDVISGSIIGYICGLLGIFTMRKFNFFRWMENKKWSPFFMVLFSASLVVLIVRIWTENLPVYYLAVVGLLLTLYKIIKAYVQK